MPAGHEERLWSAAARPDGRGEEGASIEEAKSEIKQAHEKEETDEKPYQLEADEKPYQIETDEKPYQIKTGEKPYHI